MQPLQLSLSLLHGVRRLCAMIRLALFAALIAGCAAPPADMRRDCPPLPELRFKASRLEVRAHAQTIVHMYAACAGGDHDR